jgi:tyrosyl-tRNA synthetase
VFEDAPSSGLTRTTLGAHGAGGLDVVDALTRAGLSKSKSEARRDVEGGGIYVNNRRVEDLERSLGTDDLLQGRFIVLRKGRRDYHLLRVE